MHVGGIQFSVIAVLVAGSTLVPLIGEYWPCERKRRGRGRRRVVAERGRGENGGENGGEDGREDGEARVIQEGSVRAKD